MRRVPEQLTARARRLRNAATKAERALWRGISRYRPPFTRQFAIDPYIVDLAHREFRVIVEVDGGQHADAKAYDDARTRFLENEGWVVIRLWNNDVLENLDGAIAVILDRCASRLGSTHPQPLPSREGRKRNPRSRKAVATMSADLLPLPTSGRG